MFNIIKKYYIVEDKTKKQIFLTKCRDCGKRIAILTETKYFHHNMYPCNKCCPKNSCARNGIDEPFETDLFDEYKIV